MLGQEFSTFKPIIRAETTDNTGSFLVGYNGGAEETGPFGDFPATDGLLRGIAGPQEISFGYPRDQRRGKDHLR